MAISRIYIINRGEIALRIIRTCKVLGIHTVLAVSEEDKESLPAQLADEIICIGPASASQSYLNIPIIITTALAAKVDAIHPGYGFLSEVSELAEACEEHGITFIGPKAEHIEKMGNKLVARSIAEQCGVPILKGSSKVQSVHEAKQLVAEIGLPVMLKAAAGGGGRGMKIIHSLDNLESTFESATAEAQAAFGDGSMYIERYISNARHIEVQILGDHFGNVVHLGERDCSTQRRHQKLVEEATAPNITEELRNSIRESAVKLAEFIGYLNAGTVEFIVDQDSQTYYFLEMNTRIQVEHPVTEMITGIDLIEQQIKVANKESLDFTQEEITFNGHSIECRINAESVEDNFRPTAGLIKRWDIPQGLGVRVDSHVYQGYTIPIYYDSMIAKLIVHGTTREHAIQRMLVALDEFQVEGISTTIPFLKEILISREFQSGQVHTKLIELVLA